ncbi:hypothetical protein FF1_037394 [Malus domestica]
MTTTETTEADEIMFIVDATRRRFVMVLGQRERILYGVGFPNGFEKEFRLDWERACRWRRKPEENQTLKGKRGKSQRRKE